MFAVGVGAFTLASLLCGLAWSEEALISARAFQGVGAAIMTPTALSIITTTFEEGAERNKALGILGRARRPRSRSPRFCCARVAPRPRGEASTGR